MGNKYFKAPSSDVEDGQREQQTTSLTCRSIRQTSQVIPDNLSSAISQCGNQFRVTRKDSLSYKPTIEFKTENGDAARELGMAIINKRNIDKVLQQLDTLESTTNDNIFKWRYKYKIDVKLMDDDNRKNTELSITVFHMAILSKQADIVHEFLLFQDPKNNHHNLSKMLKDTTEYTDMKQEDMDKLAKGDSGWLGKANAFHLAAKYHPESLLVIVEYLRSNDCLDKFHEALDRNDNPNKSSPLHVACKDPSSSATAILVSAGAKTTSLDKRGYSPLHIAVKSGNTKSMMSLIENHCPINGGDNAKMPIAAARTQKAVQIMLKYGSKTVEEKRSLASPFNTFCKWNTETTKELLDNCISTNGHDLDSEDLVVIYDLKLLQSEFNREDKASSSELAAIYHLIEHNCDDLIKHPLLKAFVYLQWLLKIKFFYWNLCFYIFYVIGLTLLAFQFTHMTKCKVVPATDDLCAQGCCGIVCSQPLESYIYHPNMTCHKDIWRTDSFDNILEYSQYTGEYQTQSWLFNGAYVWTIIGFIFLAGREILQAYTEKFQYVDFENTFEVVLIATALGFILTVRNDIETAGHFGAWSVFFAWIDLTLMLGRTKLFGTHTYMSVHVTSAVLWSLFVFLPALIAFAISFHLLMPNMLVFQTPISAFMKVLVMMVGELEFSTYFAYTVVHDSGGRNISVQIMFLFFMVCVSIIIMNLLIGLTVSKTEDLMDKAEVIMMRKRVFQLTGVNLIQGTYFGKYFLMKKTNGVLAQLAKLRGNYKICVKPKKGKKKVRGMWTKKIPLISRINEMMPKQCKVYLYDEETNRNQLDQEMHWNIPRELVDASIKLIRAKDDANKELDKELEQVKKDLEKELASIKNQFKDQGSTSLKDSNLLIQMQKQLDQIRKNWDKDVQDIKASLEELKQLQQQ